MGHGPASCVCRTACPPISPSGLRAEEPGGMLGRSLPPRPPRPAISRQAVEGAGSGAQGVGRPPSETSERDFPTYARGPSSLHLDAIFKM